jgi:hypothetical protein
LIEEKALGIKLAGIADLARLASSMVSMGGSVYVVHFAHKGKHYYGLLATYRDYYKYYGVPLLYYVEVDEPLKGKYLAIKVDESGERVEGTEGVRPGWICIPIVNLERKPGFVEVE